MKNNILYFILGILLVTNIAATSTAVMTIQPAKPKHTVFLKNRPDRIYDYLAKGYQITHISSSASSKTYHNNIFITYIVLVKY